MDTIQIKNIIDKIKSNVEEVRNRSITTLLTKIQTKIIKGEELAQYFIELPAILMNWINTYQLTATLEQIFKVLAIIFEVSKCKAGVDLLVSYGTIEFLCEFKDYLLSIQNTEQHLQIVNQILEILVQGKQYNNQLRATACQTIANKETVDEYFLTKGTLQQDYQKSSNSINKENIDYNNSIQAGSNRLLQVQNDQYQLQQLKSQTQSQRFQDYEQSINQTQQRQNQQQLQTMKPPIILKAPKPEKSLEFIFLPPVVFSESDEKLLFDVGVQLKFGDRKTILNLLQGMLPCLIEDFPIDFVKVKSELVQDLIVLTRKNDDELSFHSLQCQIKIIKKLIKSYRKKDCVDYVNISHQSQASQEYLSNEEKNYIKYSYPSLDTKKIRQCQDDSQSVAQKDAGYLTFYQIFETILVGTLENIENQVQIGQICKLWRQAITLLYIVKPNDPQLVKKTVLKFLLHFGEVFAKKEQALYSSVEYINVIIIAQDLMQLETPEEYTTEKGNKRLELFFQYLFNASLYCVYSEEQCNNLLKYSEFFSKDVLVSYTKIQSLTNSLKSLLIFEQGSQFLKSATLERQENLRDLINQLAEITPALPLSQNPPLIKLYIDALLSSYGEAFQSKKQNELCQQTIKDTVIKLINEPEKNYGFLIIQQLVESLGQQTSRSKLVQKLLLDVYFSYHLILSGFSSTQTTSITLELLIQFWSGYFESNQSFNLQAVEHLYQFLPVFSVLQESEDKIIQQKARILFDLFVLKNQKSYLTVLIQDLFSKKMVKRVNASKIIKQQKIIQSLIQQSYQVSLEQLHQQQTTTGQSLRDKNQAEDYLELFLNLDKTDIVEIEESFKQCEQKAKQKKKQLQFTDEEITNLINVIIDNYVDMQLKSSALEQLLEIIKCNGTPTPIEQDEKLYQFILFCQNEIEQKSTILPQSFNEGEDSSLPIQIYLTQLISIFTTYSQNIFLFSKQRSSTSVYNKLRQLCQQKNDILLLIMLKLINCPLKGLKYQCLKYLYNQVFVWNFIIDDVMIPNKFNEEQSKNNKNKENVPLLKIHSVFKEQFHQLYQKEDILFVSYHSTFREFWSEIYPLNQFEQFYIGNMQSQLSNQGLCNIQDEKVDNENRQGVNKQLFQKELIQLIKTEIRHLESRLQKSNEIKEVFKWVLHWQNLLFSIPSDSESCFDLFFTEAVTGGLIKVFQSSLVFNPTNNYAQRCYFIIGKILTSINIVDYKFQTNVQKFFGDLLDFFATTVLSYIYEIPQENLRDKLDTVSPFLQLLTKLLKFSLRSEDLHLKHTLCKKVLKQNFIQLILKCFTCFPHNEKFLDILVRFLNIVFSKVDLFANIEIDSLIQFIMDYLLIYKPDESFYNKGKLANLLRFLLQYLDIFKNSNQSMTLLCLNNNNNSSNSDEGGSGEIQNREKYLFKASTLGWVIKYTEDRLVNIRMLAWNILILVAQPQVIQVYRSIFDISIDTISTTNEAYGVVILAMRFLAKVLQIFENECDINDDNNKSEQAVESSDQVQQQLQEHPLNQEDDSDNNQLKSEEHHPVNLNQLDRRSILQVIYKRSLVSFLKTLLTNKEAPPLYYASIIEVLYQICALDAANFIAIMNQLEIWDPIVQLLNPKFYEKHCIKLCNQEVQKQICLANVLHFLLFTICCDKQISDYLIKCTDLLKFQLKWLSKHAKLYKDASLTNQFSSVRYLDDAAQKNILLLHNCLVLNEDITIFTVNKQLTEKLDKVKDISETYNFNSYTNIFQSISHIIKGTNTEKIKQAALALLCPLLTSWSKGQNLLETKDYNNEQIGESLVLQNYSQYKSIYKKIKDNSLNINDFRDARNDLLISLAAMVAKSNICKVAYICSGYFEDILRELLTIADYILIDEQSQISLTTTSALKSAGKSNQKANQEELSATIANKSIKFSARLIIASDIHFYLRVFKCFFGEVTNEIKFDSQQLQSKLQVNIVPLFELAQKLFQMAIVNDIFIEDFCKMVVNFSTNQQMNSFFCQRIIDPKAQLLNDILLSTQKFENIGKKCFAWNMKVCGALSQHKEIRQIFYRTKFLDNCVQKFLGVWQKKAQWNTNNFYAKNIIHFLVSLSFHSDSHQKILQDKNVFDMLVSILEENNVEGPLCQKILLLLANCSQENKQSFISNQKIHSIIITILSGSQFSFELKAYASQLIFNLIYKCNSAIAIYIKDAIKTELKFISKEFERELDKMLLNPNPLDQDLQQKIQNGKIILNNIAKILQILF